MPLKGNKKASFCATRWSGNESRYFYILKIFLAILFIKAQLGSILKTGSKVLLNWIVILAWNLSRHTRHSSAKLLSNSSGIWSPMKTMRWLHQAGCSSTYLPPIHSPECIVGRRMRQRDNGTGLVLSKTNKKKNSGKQISINRTRLKRSSWHPINLHMYK